MTLTQDSTNSLVTDAPAEPLTLQTEATPCEGASMRVDPTAEHRWLSRLVGEWTYSADAGEHGKAEGRESVRMLGEIWALCEANGVSPGGDAAYTQMTLGYDPTREKFVGTWIGSMMTHHWVYEGELSPDGRTLNLIAEGPDWSPEAEPGSTATYRDAITFLTDDERTLTASIRGADGEWSEFMSTTYRRAR